MDESEVAQHAQRVIEANERFYHAFQTHNFEAIAATWERSERATCVHPGREILRGWPAIAASWKIRTHQVTLTGVVVTNAAVAVTGQIAWVTVDEDLIFRDSAHTVVATNIFARHGDFWLMAAHHASIIRLS